MTETFEHILETSGTLVYHNVGDSMMPLIKQGRDVLVIERRPKGRLKRLDVPLYRRPSDPQGKYVLHRILWVRGNGTYWICGDNRRWVEKGVRDEQIIGVLKALVRNGKTIELDKSWKYKLYSHLWCDLFPLRSFLFHIRDFYYHLTGRRYV